MSLCMSQRLKMTLALSHGAHTAPRRPACLRSDKFIKRHVASKAAVTESTPLEEIPTPESVAPLFKPVKVGRYELKTRAVYAPLTRSRAIDTVPVPEAAEYYAQRTNPGQLIIAEATGVSDATKGYGYPNTPGIHTPEQMEGWKPVVKAVHDKGGIFFCQLWHTGRASHPVYHGGEQPISSSDVPITDDKVIIPDTFEHVPYPVPRPLETDEVPEYVDLFRTAARHAIDVGFDGVEIHATNGYLIAQFLEDGINKRTDKYGGSIENRCRFCLEIVKAVTEEVGSDRVGIRVGPYTGFLSTSDSDPQALYTYLVDELNKFDLAYMHFIEARVKGSVLKDEEVTESIDPIVEHCKTKVILAGGFIDESGKNNRGPEAIAKGEADLVAYGRWALANPDLLRRFKLGAPLNRFDKSTFYTPGNKGYIDYPFLEETEYGKDYVKSEA